MDRFFDFVVRHWELSALFVALLIALIMVERQRSGKSVSPQQTVLLLNRDEAVVLDVRDKKDLSEGHITGAINVSFSSLKDRISELDKYRDKTIIVVDKMGQHSGGVVKQLRQAGFTSVQRMAGGIMEWKNSGLPLKR